MVLSFSSIDPKEEAWKPKINPWYLSFAYDKVYSKGYIKQEVYVLEEVVVSIRASGLAMDREEATLITSEDISARNPSFGLC